MITSFASKPVSTDDEAVFFAFDDHSIPQKENLKLTLIPVEKHPENPVVRKGTTGAPDDRGCIIYGSVIPIDGKLRMWYLAWPAKWLDPNVAERPMAYAESTDGIHWEKPNLGVRSWRGSTDNNLCLFEPETRAVNDFLTVTYDPEDPDPGRRYKAAYIYREPGSKLKNVGSNPDTPEPTMATAVSADGFRWKLVEPDRIQIREKFEVSGLWKFNGAYYVAGQQLAPWAWLDDGQSCGRVMTVFESPDFVDWSRDRSMGFVRPGYTPVPNSQGEEVHMGAGVWNRGNVLVGLYGMWHGAESTATRSSVPLFDVRIDLGLVVSNDGAHFREPVPDFAVIPRGTSDDWDSVAIVQGHAFANVGELTYVWYAHWDCTQTGQREEIGLGTFRRDGFGYLSRCYPREPAAFTTCRFDVEKSTRMYLNADGLSPGCGFSVELIDSSGRPIPGYAADDCVPIVESGIRLPVRWSKGDVITAEASRSIRARVRFEGHVDGGESDQKLYALYLSESK